MQNKGTANRRERVNFEFIMNWGWFIKMVYRFIGFLENKKADLLYPLLRP